MNCVFCNSKVQGSNVDNGTTVCSCCFTSKQLNNNRFVSVYNAPVEAVDQHRLRVIEVIMQNTKMATERDLREKYILTLKTDKQESPVYLDKIS